MTLLTEYCLLSARRAILRLSIARWVTGSRSERHDGISPTLMGAYANSTLTEQHELVQATDIESTRHGQGSNR